MTSTQKIAIGVSLSKLLIMCLLSPLLAYGPVGPQVDPAPLIHIPVALDTIPMIDRQGDLYMTLQIIHSISFLQT